MKLSRNLFAAVLMIMLLVTSAMAQYASPGGTMDHRSMPGQSTTMPRGRLDQQQPFAQQGQAIFFSGTLSSLDKANRDLIVNTEVPGLLGPQRKDVPVRISNDTTMSICFKSANSCNSFALGEEGWNMLSALETYSNLSSVQKDVIVVGEPDTGRIIHVEVDYNV